MIAAVCIFVLCAIVFAGLLFAVGREFVKEWRVVYTNMERGEPYEQVCRVGDARQAKRLYHLLTESGYRTNLRIETRLTLPWG